MKQFGLTPPSTGRLSALSGTAWLCLAATGLFALGCTPRQAAWNGIFSVDVAGGARVCVAPAAPVPDGQSVMAQMQVSNEGGWCGISTTRSGSPFDSYLLVTRPDHGRVFAHRVGTNTRIDYTPDRGYVGADAFAVRLIPGNAIIQGAVTVTR
jgi:hypothetical protein